MRPIKIYFAGSWGAPPELASGIKHRLISHAYPGQFKRWLEMNPTEPGEIILDSGAFSAWNKGEKIDIDDYIESAHEVIEKAAEKNKETHVVNLDVIPGKVGKTKDLNALAGSKEKMKTNRKKIEKAASQGFENMKIMIENGITPIHVFHQGEDWKWLDKMIEYTDYIGISPANDLSQDAKHRWMESVFEYLYKNGADVKTHGFAVTALRSIKNLPWYSCDSTTWRLLAGFGKVIYPCRGFDSGGPVLSNDDFIHIDVSEQHGGRGYTITEEEIKLIQNDGYSYEDLQDHMGRARINLRFFLKLEEDLNTYKMKKTYKPRKTLI